MRLPHLIVIGAPKCATSSVFHWLTQHPDILGISEKDAFYFMDATSYRFNPDRNHFDYGVSGYEAMFPHSPGRGTILIDSCALYLYQKAALDILPRLPTDPVFLVIVRPPEDQIISLYHFLTNFEVHLDKGRVSLEEFVDLAIAESPRLQHVELLRYAFSYARYVEWLRRWAARVGRDRLIITSLSDVLRTPDSLAEAVCSRFELDWGPLKGLPLVNKNRTYHVKSVALQRVNECVRRQLPAGALYQTLRRLYRAVNTRGKASNALVDAEGRVRERLRPWFAESVTALREEFGVEFEERAR